MNKITLVMITLASDSKGGIGCLREIFTENDVLLRTWNSQ
jgi:hypothetical protein